MAAIGFYLFYIVNWIITLLPMRVLYAFSDFTYVLLYHIYRYRRNVVAENLRKSFPEKTYDELRIIEKKFYHHLCDLFVETFSLQHMNNKKLTERYRITNPEILDELYEKNKDVTAVLGHYGNWEWLLIIPLYTRFQTVTIYKPLQNKYFDSFMLKKRTRNKMIVTPMSHIVRDIINLRKENRRALYSFINDQIPPRGEIRYWTRFLNQDTAVYLGAEKIAMKYNMAVVFFRINKIKRGYYELTVEKLFDDVSGLPEHAITESHVKKLEEIIRERPELWVWSHRRWKHRKEEMHD